MRSPPSRAGKSVFLLSLGCPKNLVDSERMLSSLRRSGFEITSQKSEADVIIVNTCGFIRPAQEESLEALLEAAHMKRNGHPLKVAAVGCLVALGGDRLKEDLPEVDVFIPPEDEGKIGEILGGTGGGTTGGAASGPGEDRVLLTPPGSAYLKIAEGCSNRCSYCLIPSMRGHYRSRPLSRLVSEARDLTDRGVKEIVLVSQDTTAYGYDLGDGSSLEQLLTALVKIRDLHWIRLLYCNPYYFTDGLISLVRNEEKICTYLDIPVQHVSDRVLEAMNRKTTGREIRTLFEGLRREIPGLCLRSTAIVGFPGETDEEFAELLSFVKEADIQWFGAFPYFPEEGTPASGLPYRIPTKVREDRWNAFMALQSSISQAKNEARVGQEARVLVEGTEDGRTVGRTWFQAPEVDGRTFLEIEEGIPYPAPGNFRTVRIVDGLTYDLIAR